MNGDSGVRRSFAIGAIVLLGVLSAFNALPNGFTYDDRFIVVANPAVREIRGWEQFFLLPYWPLHQGGDGYRPLTTFLFALEWAVSNGPLMFHLVSLALYVVCCLLVWWLGRKVVSARAAWWAAAVFAVHPVHTEVTGGAVGQAEMLAAITILWATGLYIGGRQRGRITPLRQVGIVVLFLLGCLAKEHVLVLPLLLFVAEGTVLRGESRPRARLREARFLLVAFTVIAIGFIQVRAVVIPLGTVGFAPFTPFTTLETDAWDRAVTMLGIVPHWLRLLVWPRRLSTEYAPPAYPVGPGIHMATCIGVVILIAAAVAVLRTWRSCPAVAFAVAWLIILLGPVSNVLFPTGVLLAERTLFAPSVGACLLYGGLIVAVLDRASASTSVARVSALVATGSLFVLGTARSVIRLSDWRDNQSLFEAGVASEPRVYRAHYMLGAWYFETGRWSEAQREMETARRLFDRDPAVSYNLGIGYFLAGDFAKATAMFEEVERIMPGALDTRTKIALALAAEGRFPEAQQAAMEALRGRSQDGAAMRAVVEAAALVRKSAARGAR